LEPDRYNKRELAITRPIQSTDNARITSKIADNVDEQIALSLAEVIAHILSARPPNDG